ncbi:MAG TPA: glycosyltransferase family 4 protein [Terriglobales bacterium]
MHVLITTDTLNGNWTYTRELASGLITRGFRVTLVSFGEIPLPHQTAWMERLYGLSYHPSAFRLDWMQEGQHDFYDASAYLCSLIKDLKPDIFHSNHLCYGALPVRIPRVVVAHGDLITWWKAVHGRDPRDSAWLRWYRRTIGEGISAASAVVASSEWMLNSIRAAYCEGMRETVIHNGRNPIFFNPYVAKEDSVLAIGRLLDAAKQVNLLTLESHPVPVCIVGDDSVEPVRKVPLRADVQFRDGCAGVALKGPQSESQLRMLYSKASIYAGTARYEASGMTILEAALSRCALILNDIPPYRELWGNAALYFRTNDSGSLAETVRLLAEDPQLRRNFANRAFQRARESFNAHRMTDNYVQLYRSIAAKKVFAA